MGARWNDLMAGSTIGIVDFKTNVSYIFWYTPVSMVSTPTHLCTYVTKINQKYWRGNLIDDDLLVEFQEDFEIWDTDMWDKVHPEFRKMLRRTIRGRGLYTGPKAAQPGPQFLVVAAAPQMLEWEPKELRKEHFTHECEAFFQKIKMLEEEDRRNNTSSADIEKQFERAASPFIHAPVPTRFKAHKQAENMANQLRYMTIEEEQEFIPAQPEPEQPKKKSSDRLPIPGAFPDTTGATQETTTTASDPTGQQANLRWEQRTTSEDDPWGPSIQPATSERIQNSKPMQEQSKPDPRIKITETILDNRAKRLTPRASERLPYRRGAFSDMSHRKDPPARQETPRYEDYVHREYRRRYDGPPTPPPMDPPVPPGWDEYSLPPRHVQNAPIELRTINEFAKGISDINMFTGEPYCVLDVKMKMFFSLCKMANIYEDQFHAVFPKILKGRAAAYYHLHAKGPDTFMVTYTRLKTHFDTEINRNLYFRDWTHTSFESVQADPANAGKTGQEMLALLVDKLQMAAQALGEPYTTTDAMMHAALIQACRAHAQFDAALFTPKPTVEGLMSDLRQSLAQTEARAASQYVQEPGQEEADQELYVTDRKYISNKPYRGSFSSGQTGGYGRSTIRSGQYQNRYRGEGRSRPSRPGPSAGRPSFRRNDRPDKRKSDKCYICFKNGCWSTNHTAEERKAARAQYFTDCEANGEEPMEYEIFLLHHEGNELDDEEDSDIEESG